MSVYDVAMRRRTIRLFQQRPVPRELLTVMVDVARVAPSGANMQPLRFVVVDEPELCERVFAQTAWAGHVAPRRTPGPGHRPTAYVAVLIDRRVRATGGEHDAGAAMMSMILTAAEAGVGACWIGSLQRARLAEILGIPADLAIDSVLALGYPAEQPVADECTGDTRYWLDADDVLHVPKHRLADVMHWQGYGRADTQATTEA